jgi:hypothetical protein
VSAPTSRSFFLFVNQWLLRPIEAEDPARLIRITGPGGDSAGAGATENEAHILPRDYLAYRDRNQSFDGLAAGHIGGPMRMRVDGPPQMVPVTPTDRSWPSVAPFLLLLPFLRHLRCLGQRNTVDEALR